MHVAARRVIFAEHMHRPQDLHAGRVHRHQDLGLLAACRAIVTGAHHHDHHLAARITGTRDIEFLAVDHPVLAITHGTGADVLGIRRGHIGLGHGIGRADFTGEQGLQPALLLLVRANPFQHFHVAGVGRRAVQ